MNEIIIGVVGSRRRNTDRDYDLVLDRVWHVIKKIRKEQGLEEARIPISECFKICSGGCRTGADSFVHNIAERIGITFYKHLPVLPENYEELPGQYKKWAYAKACYTRNTLIAKDSHILVACVAEDRTGGTEDTIKKFIKIHRGMRPLELVK